MKDANIPTTTSSSATKNNPVFCPLNPQSLNNKSDAKNSNDSHKTGTRKPSVVKLPEALPQISSNIVRTKPCIADKTGSKELNLTVAMINCESSNNKADNIADYILEQDLDICCLTETWLNSDDTVTIGELFPNGYEIISVPRKDRRGGGVAVIIKQSLSIKFNCSKETTFRSFEHLNSIVSHPKHSQPLNLTIVYRPPRSNKNTLPISVFFDEISDLLAAYTITTTRLLITGDFNVHFDEPEKPDVCKFLQIIESFGLKQHVSVPTHVAGHTLDLVITRDDCDFLSNSQAHFMMTSHSTVLFKLNWTKPHRPAVTRSSRKIKEIDLNKFRSDLQSYNILLKMFTIWLSSTSPLCWQSLTTLRLLSQWE